MRVLALAALAAAPHVTAATPVTAVAVTGNRIAYATADCRVHLWDRTTRRVVTFGRGPACEKTSTGTAVAAVSIAGTRVVFVHYTGGNIREWSLWTATATSPKPRRLAFATSDPSAAPPIVLGDKLAYAVGRTVTVLRPNGSRALRWTAPAAVTALTSNRAGTTVATTDGEVRTIGRGTQSFAQAPTALAVTGNALVVQYGRTLESRGLRPRTFTLAMGTRLVGAAGRRAVIVDVRGAVRTIDLVTGAGTWVGRGTLAAVDGTRLVTARGRLVSAGAV